MINEHLDNYFLVNNYIAAEGWNSVIPESHTHVMSEPQEKFKDINGVIGIRKSQDRQCKCQKIKYR